MKLLSTFEGTKIAVTHVVTVGVAMNHSAYSRDAGSYWQAKRAVRDAQDSEQEKQLKEALDGLFPKGKPEWGDYFETRVSCTDGKTYFVEQSMEEVVSALAAIRT